MTTHKLNYYRPFGIGFDRMFNEFESLLGEVKATYPPHNIVKEADDRYKIEIAVAGLNKDDISIEVKDRVLTIIGQKAEDDSREFVHRGISTKAFTRVFNLAEYVEVKSAKQENGILSITLSRNVPQERLPILVRIE